MTIFHRIILVVMACISMCTSAIAQTPCNEDKGISTNPDAAVNTEKPSKQNGPHNGDNRPVIFDWRRPLFDIRSSLTTSVDINSPFYERWIHVTKSTNVGQLSHSSCGGSCCGKSGISKLILANSLGHNLSEITDNEGDLSEYEVEELSKKYPTGNYTFTVEHSNGLVERRNIYTIQQ